MCIRDSVYNEYLKNTGVDRDSQTEESIDLRFLNEYIDSLAEELPAQRKKIFIRVSYTHLDVYKRQHCGPGWNE